MNGQWFFTTREGEQGPYHSRDVALKEVARFVQERKASEQLKDQRLRPLRNNERIDLEIIPELVPKSDKLDLTLDDLLPTEDRS